MVQRPPAGTIPDAPGLVPVQGRGRAGSSTSARPSRCAQRLSQLLPDAAPAAAHRADGGGGRDGRVDPGPQRRRGADAGEHADQAAPAPVQRPAARRQELPVPRRHRRRRVAPPDGDAGPQAQGRPVLRALRPRLRHPRDARPAAAHLPAPHLLGQQVRPAPAARPARACCSTSRSAPARASARSPRRSTTSTSRSCSQFLDGDTDAVVQELETRDARGGRRARVRAGRPAARPAHERAARPSRSSRWWPSAPRTSTCSASPTTSSRRPCRCSSSARAAWSGRKGFIVDKVEDLTAGRAGRATCVERPLRRPAARASPRRCSCRSTSRTPTLYEEWLVVAARLQGHGARAAAGRASASCRRPSPATPARSSSATGCGGRRTTTAGPRRSTSCRSSSACPRPRCGSSATT